MLEEKDEIISKEPREDIADLFSQSGLTLDEPKHSLPNKISPSLLATIQNADNLLKALNEFSNRYNVDNRHSLSNKKFLLTFEDLMSLIKDAILYQKKISELIYFEKDKIKDITQDYINNLSYTIFSYEKIEIPEINTSIKINRKTYKSPTFSSTNSNNQPKSLANFSSLNYLKVTESQTMKIRKKYEVEKTERKDLVKTLTNNVTKKNLSKTNTQALITRLATPKRIKTPYKKNKTKIMKSIEKKKLNEDYSKDKINNEPPHLNTMIKRKNSENSSKIKIQTNNNFINNFKKKDSENTFNIDLLKNNSVVLRSKTLKNKKENAEKENEKKKNFSNIIDALNNCSVYSEDRKVTSSQNITSTPNLRRVGIIRTQIMSNAPKPSIMANKLLECSRKYINDFNGIKEKEREKKYYSVKRK